MEKFDIYAPRWQPNYDLVERMMKNPWWEPEYQDLFDDAFCIEYPYAPPGMYQSLGIGQSRAFMKWMSSTVKNWTVENMSLWGPRDPFGDTFFVIRWAGGDVHWGGQDGHFYSRHVSRVTVRGGKIVHLREWSNPLKWLEAAGRSIPVFKQVLDFEKSAERLKNTPPRPEYDLSPEACAKRAVININSFIDAYTDNLRTYSETYRHAIWNAPPAMLEEYPPEQYHVFDQWIADSMQDKWYWHEGQSTPYATDDPHIYFFELGGGSFKINWQGNNITGGYANRYIKFLELDDYGFIQRYDETLNPINKFNSINQILPSFPFMF